MKEINFEDLMELIRKIAKVYDNRTAKNYIDCMIDNEWLIPKYDNPHFDGNPYDVIGTFVITSVFKYRKVTWEINEEAKYDNVDEETILKEILEKNN